MENNTFQNIPEWVIEYNQKGYQSGAGKAIAILLKEIERLQEINKQYFDKIQSLITQLESK